MARRDDPTTETVNADRPLIGVCTALESACWAMWEQPAALLPRSYLDAVQRAGGLAVMLPPDRVVSDDPAQLIGLLDGLMLAGGADIDPATYGRPPHPLTVGTVPERDAFEMTLVRGAIAAELPLLGICRGMQVMNVALGGTLVQDLPQRLGHHEHLRRAGTFEGSEHEVSITEGSLAAEAAGETLHTVSSHHHQGVEEIGDGLLVTATATMDGLPEALERPGARFALGVQWHPEADPASPVIGAFVAAARRARAARPRHAGAVPLARDSGL